MGCRVYKRLLLADRCDYIYKFGGHAELFLERRLENIEICTLDIFTEEFRRNLDSESRLNERNRLDRPEPQVELLRVNVLLNEIQTVVPY